VVGYRRTTTATAVLHSILGGLFSAISRQLPHSLSHPIPMLFGHTLAARLATVNDS